MSRQNLALSGINNLEVLSSRIGIRTRRRRDLDGMVSSALNETFGEDNETVVSTPGQRSERKVLQINYEIAGKYL